MTVQSEIERDKAVVHAFYQAGIDGQLTSFARYLHPDFTWTAPNYLPWGGTHTGATVFRDQVLSSLPDVSISRGSATSALSPRTAVSTRSSTWVSWAPARPSRSSTVGPSGTARSRLSGLPISNPRRCLTGSASSTGSSAEGRCWFEAASAQKDGPRTFQMLNHTQRRGR